MVTEERQGSLQRLSAIANTQMIIDSCDFQYDFETPKIKNIIPTSEVILHYLQH
jgi:hypothetical protein